MSKYTSDELATLDIDWFGVDSSGSLGHFTSASTQRVPDRVKASREALHLALEYCSKLDGEQGSFSIDPLSKRWLIWPGSGGFSESFIESFAEFAEKGFYSFDCRKQGGLEGPYVLVAVPKLPRSVLDLPREIARYLDGIRYSGRFDELNGDGIEVSGDDLVRVAHP